jgi:hypothetical protein
MINKIIKIMFLLSTIHYHGFIWSMDGSKNTKQTLFQTKTAKDFYELYSKYDSEIVDLTIDKNINIYNIKNNNLALIKKCLLYYEYYKNINGQLFVEKEIKKQYKSEVSKDSFLENYNSICHLKLYTDKILNNNEDIIAEIIFIEKRSEKNHMNLISDNNNSPKEILEKQNNHEIQDHHEIFQNNFMIAIQQKELNQEFEAWEKKQDLFFRNLLNNQKLFNSI